MRVGVERAPSWAATTPTLLVKEGYYTSPGAYPSRTYDIAPDGQRFLMIKEGGGTDARGVGPDRWRPDRRATAAHRRAALGRGAEAPRADPITPEAKQSARRARQAARVSPRCGRNRRRVETRPHGGDTRRPRRSSCAGMSN